MPEMRFRYTLVDFGLWGAVTTGIGERPRCEWAGKIEIRVVEADRLGE
jgi:hypothetical protein